MFDRKHAPLCIFAMILLSAAPAHADNWLQTITEVDQGQSTRHISIQMSQPLRLITRFTSQDRVTYKAEAELDSASASTGWQFVELELAEEEYSVAAVSLEGSNSKGFDVTITFHRPTMAETLPQLSLNQIALTAIDPGDFERLADFGDIDDALPLAIELPLQGLLRSDAMPRDVAMSKAVYVPPSEPDKVRIGFFPTHTAALSTLQKIRGRYPGASIVATASGEQDYGNALRLFPAANDNTDPTDQTNVTLQAAAVTPRSIDAEPTAVEVETPWAEELDRSLLDEARQAQIDKDFSRAIGLYSKAAKIPPLRQEALEMLGVARESNGQRAHAKAVYEKYLLEFADTPQAVRVRQRLQSLIGDTEERTALRTPRSRNRDGWRVLANLSQFYRRHSLEIDGGNDTVPVDALFTDGTLIARHMSSSGDFHEGRVSLGHIQDFGDSRTQQAFRVQRVSWESYFDRWNTGFKLGRQSQRKAGIPGRFDGVTLTHKQSDALQWNLVGGDLVKSSYNNRDPEQRVYGVSVDMTLLDDSLQFSPFFVQQYYDGMLDRRAVGTYLTWQSTRTRASMLVDYDVHYSALNNFYINVAHDLNDTWRLHTTADHRRSPYLTTSNALIGQAYDDLSQLERDLIDLKLGDVAEDRTATSTTFRVGVDGDLSEKWILSMEASAADYNSTSTSAGVAGIPARKDYYWSAQLRANDFLLDNSYSAIRFRASMSETSSSNSLFLTNRTRFGKDWLWYTRLLLMKRDFDTTNQEQLQIKPSLRVDYRGFNAFNLEAEIGYDWSTRTTSGDDIDIQGLFFRVGYRTRF